MSDVIIMILMVSWILFSRRPGGDKIYGVFDNQLPAALKKLPFDRHLSLNNVKRVISEADGYQPHLIAPEQGYRRLIDSSLHYFKGPAEASVDAVSAVAPFPLPLIFKRCSQLLSSSQIIIYYVCRCILY